MQVTNIIIHHLPCLSVLNLQLSGEGNTRGSENLVLLLLPGCHFLLPVQLSAEISGVAVVDCSGTSRS